MSAPELSRPFDVRQCEGRTVEIIASDAERAALARRFEIVAIGHLTATLTLRRDGETVLADGTMRADLVQTCAVSAEEIGVPIEEPLSLRFVPARAAEPEEEDREIDSSDRDEIDYSGSTIDLGEAVAQSLALAIDPFVTGPDAAQARAALNEVRESPFAGLAALKGRLGGNEG